MCNSSNKGKYDIIRKVGTFCLQLYSFVNMLLNYGNSVCITNQNLSQISHLIYLMHALYYAKEIIPMAGRVA